VEGANDIMIHNIYRPQGTSSIISKFSQQSNNFDFFSATPDTSDVFFLPHHGLFVASVDHNLLGDFVLHHSLWGEARATADTMAENLISFINAHFLYLPLPHESITH
jgi:hypothetical protein